jgi:hypothetical protein
VQEACRTPNRHDQKRTYPCCIIEKNVNNIEKLKKKLKTARIKCQVTYKDKLINFIRPFSRKPKNQENLE